MAVPRGHRLPQYGLIVQEQVLRSLTEGMCLSIPRRLVALRLAGHVRLEVLGSVATRFVAREDAHRDRVFGVLVVHRAGHTEDAGQVARHVHRPAVRLCLAEHRLLESTEEKDGSSALLSAF